MSLSEKILKRARKGGGEDTDSKFHRWPEFPGKKAKETVQKEKKLDEVVEAVEDNFDPYEIIKYPLSTEKSIRQIEFDNKLVFAVHPRATKSDVRRAVQELFKVRVIKINIQNSFSGEKKAYVKLGPESLASDVSADLGLI